MTPESPDQGSEFSTNKWMPDSSILPEEWGLERLKHASQVRPSTINKKSREDEIEIKLCNYTEIYNHEIIDGSFDFMKATANDGEINRFELREGDILFTKDSEDWKDIGIPAYISEDLSGIVCGYHLFLCRPDEEQIHPKFLFWSLKSRYVAFQFEGAATGVTRYGLTTRDAGNAWIPCPPYDQQSEIATYLDSQTQIIDKTIEDSEKLLGHLDELRQSTIRSKISRGVKTDTEICETGLPWLERIPGHWVLGRVGWYFDIQLGKMLDEKQISGENLAPYLRNQDVQWWDINTEDLPKMDFTTAERLKYNLQQGDVLVCEGGEIGRSAVWTCEDTECYYQKALHRVRPLSEDQNPRYFCYFMEFAANNGVFTAYSDKSTIEHLTAEKLRKQHMPIPPKEEQDHIVDELDTRLQKIENLKDEIEEEIAYLQEKRRALITKATTGQIDLSNRQPPEIQETAP